MSTDNLRDLFVGSTIENFSSSEGQERTTIAVLLGRHDRRRDRSFMRHGARFKMTQSRRTRPLVVWGLRKQSRR